MADEKTEKKTIQLKINRLLKLYYIFGKRLITLIAIQAKSELSNSSYKATVTNFAPFIIEICVSLIISLL